MTISHRVDSQSLAGLLSGFVGVDVPFATISGSFRMTRLDLRVTDAPSGGTVAAMVNTVTGGGGSALLQGTIADGDRHVSVTGDIALSGTTTFYLRITAESGAALGLSASVELSLPDGGTATVFLSTLDNVKHAAKVTGSANDAAIQRHLEGVSKAMQNWMGRQIISTAITAEYHFPTGLNSAILLEDGPVSTLTEVRLSGSILAATGYRLEGARLLRRIAGSARTKWEQAEVEVDYTAGYAAVPADLVEACTQEAATRWLRSVASGGPGLHVNAKTPETGDTKTFDTGPFLPQTIAAMSPYRRLA